MKEKSMHESIYCLHDEILDKVSKNYVEKPVLPSTFSLPSPEDITQQLDSEQCPH